MAAEPSRNSAPSAKAYRQPSAPEFLPGREEKLAPGASQLQFCARNTRARPRRLTLRSWWPSRAEHTHVAHMPGSSITHRPARSRLTGREVGSQISTMSPRTLSIVHEGMLQGRLLARPDVQSSREPRREHRPRRDCRMSGPTSHRYVLVAEIAVGRRDSIAVRGNRNPAPADESRPSATPSWWASMRKAPPASRRAPDARNHTTSVGRTAVLQGTGACQADAGAMAQRFHTPQRCGCAR